MNADPATSKVFRPGVGGGRTSEEVSAALRDALKEAGVTLTACLPDDWVSPLIARLDEEPTITNVRVAREPEIVGIVSGAFFGGVRAAGVLGATGFLTCISELGGLALKHGIPVFLIVSLRSGAYEHQTFQETQSRTLRRLVETLDYPYLLVDRPERIDVIPDAYQASRLHKRPYIVWLTKALLQGRTPDL